MMCTNSEEDMTIHFTFSKEQIVSMKHELIARKNDLKGHQEPTRPPSQEMESWRTGWFLTLILVL